MLVPIRHHVFPVPLFRQLYLLPRTESVRGGHFHLDWLPEFWPESSDLRVHEPRDPDWYGAAHFSRQSTLILKRLFKADQVNYVGVQLC